MLPPDEAISPAGDARCCSRCGEPISGDFCASCAFKAAWDSADSVGGETSTDEAPPLRLAHYRLETNADGGPLELGRGGMGVTYRAYDERLHLPVVLKVIAPDRDGDSAAEALFFREARAAARVRHSNVASVLYLHDTPGEFFYAMEFVAGQNLQEWIKARGPTKPAAALRIAAQIVRGLGAIHAQGIVHRDLKPANIMLVSRGDAANGDAGQVKIVDFGLARAMVRTGSETPSVGFRGTTLYASPEQCEERPNLDGRSDLYSLGCILFELVTGSPPFAARTQRELMNLHVLQPPPLERLAGLPPALRNLIVRLLAKKPEDRPSNCDVLLRDFDDCVASLEAGAKVPAAATTKPAPVASANPARAGSLRVVSVLCGAILLGIGGLLVLRGCFLEPPAKLPSTARALVVLPVFRADQDAIESDLGDGLADLLSGELSSLRAFPVIAPESTAHFRRERPADRELVGRLHASLLLEPSIEKSGDQFRVRVGLIELATGATLWSAEYPRTLAEVWSLPAEIAPAIARALGLPTPGARAPVARSTSGDAQLALAAGRRLLRTPQAGAAELEGALAKFQQCLQLDPNCAAAHAEISLLHTRWYDSGQKKDEERLALARGAADVALRLDPGGVAGNLAQGMLLARGFGVRDRAALLLGQVLVADPEHPIALLERADIDRREGRWDAALAALRRAAERNPLHLRTRALLAETLLFLRRYPEGAAELADSLSALGANGRLARLQGELGLARDGRIEALRPSVALLEQRGDRSEESLVERIELLLLEGRFDQAAQTLAASDFTLGDWPTRYLIRDALAAEILTQAGRAAEARPYWQRALAELKEDAAAHPASPPIRLAAALAAAGCGETTLAREEAHAAIELPAARRDAMLYPIHLEAAALVAFRAGNLPEAKELLTRALGLPGPCSRARLKRSPAWSGFPVESIAEASKW